MKIRKIRKNKKLITVKIKTYIDDSKSEIEIYSVAKAKLAKGLKEKGIIELSHLYVDKLEDLIANNMGYDVI